MKLLPSKLSLIFTQLLSRWILTRIVVSISTRQVLTPQPLVLGAPRPIRMATGLLMWLEPTPTETAAPLSSSDGTQSTWSPLRRSAMSCLIMESRSSVKVAAVMVFPARLTRIQTASTKSLARPPQVALETVLSAS